MINVPLFLFTIIIHTFYYGKEVKRYDHRFIVSPDLPLAIVIYEAHCIFISPELDPSVKLYSIGINALHDFESFISNWKWI